MADQLSVRCVLGLAVLSGCIALSACEQSTDTAEPRGKAPTTVNQETPETTEPTAMAQQRFSPRPQTPRIPPVDPNDESLTEAQRAMLASRPDYNIYKTLVRHVELYNRWSPLGRVLLNASTLPPRHREIVMLRMGWLCQSEYEWAQHARIATSESVGMTADEVRRIAAEPDSDQWTPFERTLMDMVDELRYEAMISDATWTALQQEYSLQEIIDAMFTAAQYQLVSMALNSTGIQLDPELEFRLPGDVPKPALAERVTSPRLSQPRVPPLGPEDWSEQQREIIAPQVRDDGTVLNLYGTLIHHPDLYTPRYTFGSYLQRDSGLPSATRELVIMRTGYLIGAEYEWAHHVPYALEAGLSDADIQRIAAGPDAAGWSEEYRAVLSAVDELRRQAFITDATWAALNEYYDNKQLLEIIFTSGGYTMTGLAINSLGIQVEPGYTGFPE